MCKIYKQKDHRKENTSAQPHSKFNKWKLREMNCFLMYLISKTQSFTSKVSQVSKCSK